MASEQKGKTNEEIEEALKLCSKGDENLCKACPYHGNGCELHLIKDVLGYIRYLKTRIELAGRRRAR